MARSASFGLSLGPTTVSSGQSVSDQQTINPSDDDVFYVERIVGAGLIEALDSTVDSQVDIEIEATARTNPVRAQIDSREASIRTLSAGDFDSEGSPNRGTTAFIEFDKLVDGYLQAPDVLTGQILGRVTGNGTLSAEVVGEARVIARKVA